MSFSQDPELLRIFRDESEELLGNMSRIVAQMAREGGGQEEINELFRVAHTLKGNALAMGLTAIGDMAHATEGVLAALRKGSLKLTPAVVGVLEASALALRDLHGQEVVTTTSELAFGIDGPTHVTVRVEIKRLDTILRDVEDVTVSLARMQERARLLAQEDGARRAAGLGELVLDLEVDWRRLDGIHAAILETRLVRFGTLGPALANVVADAADLQGVEVRFLLMDGEVRMDAHTVETLREPLSHLLRNAIAHGVEPPDQREAAGKSPFGMIRVSARQTISALSVTVEDDGRGLDPTSILRSLRARGLIDEAATPTDEELFDLLFRAGFSTRAAADRLAGRGVGLDVVKKTVTAVGGSAKIRPRHPCGAAVELMIPPAVAAFRTFAVSAFDTVLLFPEAAVTACVADGGEASYVRVEGEAVPRVDLRILVPGASQGLAAAASRGSAPLAVVLATPGAPRFAIPCDEVFGSMYGVVRPLSPSIRESTDVVAGTAVWRDGRIALLLDPDRCWKSAQRASS